MQITVTPETFRLAQVFRIARGARTEARVLTVNVSDGTHAGRGECVPYARYGESIESVTAQIEGLPADVSRGTLQSLLPPGAARNALDCALWDFEAKAAGRRVWTLAGLPEPGPEVTAFTLSLDAPENMQAAARQTRTGRCSRSNSGHPMTCPGSRRCAQGRPRRLSS